MSFILDSIELKYLFVIACTSLCGFFFLSAYGDGLASEVLPPETVGNANVSLSVSATGPSLYAPTADKQVVLQLLDSNGNPVSDVTFVITAFKGGNPLFGHIFKEDGGKITMILVKADSNTTSIVEENQSIFGQLSGSDSDTVDIIGPDFNPGLYKFHVEILSAFSYNNLAIPVKYDLKISIPEYNRYTINDNTDGTQDINVIAYYDQIKNFQYDSAKKTINFVMPFDWSTDNINAVSVVHQEIMIPRSFESYMVTKYDAYVNGIKLPDKAVTIDDFSSNDSRIIHVIMYKDGVANLALEQYNIPPEMDFVVLPSNQTGFPLKQYTTNGQFIVSVSWNPPRIVSGSNTAFSFRILDPYTINQTGVSASYDFSVILNHQPIFHKSGTTNSSGGETVNVPFPANTTGPITIAFENLKGNSFAGAEFASVVTGPVGSPEFPSGSMIVLLIIFTIFISFSTFTKYRTR